MMPRQRILAMISGAALAGILGVSMVTAQTGGSYSVTWFALPGGGGTSSGGNYSVTGAIGQPFAGEAVDGSYTVQTGFFGSSGQRFQLFIINVARGVISP